MKRAGSVAIRILRWSLTLALGIVALALCLVAAVAFWVYLRPQEAWKFAEKHVLPNDLKIHWQEIHVGATHTDWRHWFLKGEVAGLSVQKLEPSLKAEIDRAEIQLAVALFAPDFKLSLLQLTVHSSQSIEFQAGEPTVKSAPQNYYQLLHSLLPYLRHASSFTDVGAIDISLSQLKYKAAGRPDLSLELKIQKSTDRQIPIAFSLTTPKLNVVEAVQASGQIDLAQLDHERPFFTAHAVAQIRGVKLNLPLAMTYQNGKFTLLSEGKVDFRAAKRQLRFKPRLLIEATKNEIDLHIKSPIVGLGTPMARVSAFDAFAHLPIAADQEWSASPATFGLNIPFALLTLDGPRRVQVERQCHCKMPEHLQAHIRGQAWPKALLEDKAAGQTVLDANLAIDPIANKLFSATLGARLKVTRDTHGFVCQPFMDSQFTVHSFQSLRKILDAENILIPAPLDILDGTIQFTAHGPVSMEAIDGQPTQLNAGAVIEADLRSKNQHVQIKSEIFAKCTSDFKRADVDVKTHIDEIKLELPPLDPIAGLPKITRDRRILITPPVAAKPSAFKLYLTASVVTAKPGAIRLLSNLFRPYFPLSIDLSRKASGDLAGALKVEPFQVNYLRRKLFVDGLTLDLSETANDDYPIRGDFHVDQTEYKVLIHIGGTVAKPIIELSSDPYLGRSDIISVLLYDRTNDELISGDAENVGNVQAALADRAIGLFGLWAFASTPIKSFTYNPVTKIYKATIDLGGGITTGVGTDWDQNASLELRKRISQRWVLTASWNPGQNQNDVGQVVLQWERRF